MIITGKRIFSGKRRKGELMRQLDTQSDAWKFNDKEFKRLAIDYESKGTLALSAELWFPYSGDISVSVCYRLKGGEAVFLDKLIVGTPYPNKNIRSVQKRLGRKKTTNFIPIIFDSLNELYQVESVEVIWNIRGIEFVIAEYPIKFKVSNQKGIYVLQTRDIPACVIANENNEDFQQPFINADGHIEVHDGSVYDDICFFSINKDKLKTIAELHSSKSTFDIEEIINSELILCCSLLACEMGNNKELFSTETLITYSETLITYYRMSAELNDEGIIIF